MGGGGRNLRRLVGSSCLFQRETLELVVGGTSRGGLGQWKEVVGSSKHYCTNSLRRRMFLWVMDVGGAGAGWIFFRRREP